MKPLGFIGGLFFGLLLIGGLSCSDTPIDPQQPDFLFVLGLMDDYHPPHQNHQVFTQYQTSFPSSKARMEKAIAICNRLLAPCGETVKLETDKELISIVSAKLCRARDAIVKPGSFDFDEKFSSNMGIAGFENYLSGVVYARNDKHCAEIFGHAGNIDTLAQRLNLIGISLVTPQKWTPGEPSKLYGFQPNIQGEY